MTNMETVHYEWFTNGDEGVFRIIGVETQKGIRLRGVTKETMTRFYRLLCDNEVYPEHLMDAAEDYLLGLICPE